MLPVLFQGFVIGFSLAAPVGPMGLLCINRTLAQGLTIGLLTGAGVALADTFYGLVAVFGLTAVSDFLISNKATIGLFGGLFLAWLGLKTLLKSESKATDTGAQTKNGIQSLVSAFALTVSNPMTILVFVAIFSSVAASASLPMVGAIFAGSMTWWLILSVAVSITKTKMKPIHLRAVDICSGLILIGFGFYAVISAIPELVAS